MPYTHALYWGFLALQYAGDERSFDTLRHKRVIYHNLQHMYHQGGTLRIYSRKPKLDITKETKSQEIFNKVSYERLLIYNTQDIRMFHVANMALQDIIQDYKDNAPKGKVPGGLESGFVNLTRNGIVSLYHAGYIHSAYVYLNRLSKRYPEEEDYKLGLEAFTGKLVKDEILSGITYKKADNYIISALIDSYNQLAGGNYDAASQKESFARQIYDLFLKESPQTEDMTQRLTLPAFADMKWRALINVLSDASVPGEIKGILLSGLKSHDNALYNKALEEMKVAR